MCLTQSLKPHSSFIKTLVFISCRTLQRNDTQLGNITHSSGKPTARLLNGGNSAPKRVKIGGQKKKKKSQLLQWFVIANMIQSSTLPDKFSYPGITSHSKEFKFSLVFLLRKRVIFLKKG